MFNPIGSYVAGLLLAAFVVLAAGCGATAEDIAWQVSKSSGEVWLTTSGVQQASLTDETILKPGDNIRTGRNGRVLLVRGEETMLISPNSDISIPAEPNNGLSTTIIQRAGSVLLEVEKRNVKHFEVETPYLAAVVKGTQFRVSVNRQGASVDVFRGQVEVADFKSGQLALVLPGQAAKVSKFGPGGLSLTGSGKLNPVEHGAPRRSSVEPVPVPKGGLAAPRSVPDGQAVRALRNMNSPNGSQGTKGADGAIHIKSPLGEVKVDFQKVTNGLAREATAPAGERTNAAKQTVWSSGELSPGNGAGKAYGSANSNAGGNGNAAGNSSAAANGNAASAGNGVGNANGIGNGIGAVVGNGNGAAHGVGTTNPNANANAHKL